MGSLKELTIESLRKLPEDASLDDIMYHVNFVAQVLEGLKDAEEGKTISTEELLRCVDQWSFAR